MINVRSYPIPKDIKKYEKIQKLKSLRETEFLLLRILILLLSVMARHGSTARYAR